MVCMTYTIKCSCGESLSGRNASSDSDRYMDEFSCRHFRCARFHSTKLGWLFGNSPKVAVDFEIRCRGKNCHETLAVRHGFWGDTQGSKMCHMKECCGYKIEVASAE
jgi:hypothetical protein